MKITIIIKWKQYNNNNNNNNEENDNNMKIMTAKMTMAAICNK
jgi:hypothetical protein